MLCNDSILVLVLGDAFLGTNVDLEKFINLTGIGLFLFISVALFPFSGYEKLIYSNLQKWHVDESVTRFLYFGYTDQYKQHMKKWRRVCSSSIFIFVCIMCWSVIIFRRELGLQLAIPVSLVVSSINLGREADAKRALEIEMFGNAILYKDGFKPGGFCSRMMAAGTALPSSPWWIWIFIAVCSLLPLFFYVEVYSACIALVAIALCIVAATFLNVDSKYRVLVCAGISIVCGVIMYCTILLVS